MAHRKIYRDPAIDWAQVRGIIEPLEPAVWEVICSKGFVVDDRRLRLGGYTLRIGFKDYAPRFEYSAEIILPEPSGMSSREIDDHMDHITRQLTLADLGLSFRLDIQPSFPMIGTLERDPVFGPEPEVPPRIGYIIRPSREDLERLFPKL